MQLALELIDLKKSYGALEAVKGVTLSIKPGEIFGLLGPNGAGKTSIISIITTLEKPSAGQVKVFGYDVEKDPMQTKRLLGVVGQEVVNSGFFDVFEILEFMSGYYGILKNKERIDYIMNKLGLYEHRQKKVKQLSGGMKRRLMVAKALVHKPKLLLLDEPTAGVDINLREDLWAYVRELQQEGMSILLTTHYLMEAEELCHQVGIIDRGQLKFVGPTNQIIEQFSAKKIMIKLRKDRDSITHKNFLKKKDGFFEFQIPSQESMGGLFRDLSLTLEDVEDIKTEQGSLEEAFKQIVSK
ncbi:MAG: ABC transporter ATP-binding protein [Bdellovibrionaceae bacterium]|nr:ABC transporter ATP-binding protein [Pseudobdellovibrionaceae bacterium]